MSRHEVGRSIRAAWAPSRARRLVRHRATAALAVLTAAAVAWTSVAGHTQALDEARAQWTDRGSVLVVVEAVAAGDAVLPAVERREYPRIAIPPMAIERLDPSAVAAVDLLVGDVVVGPRLVGDAASDLENGTVAVTVEVARAAPLVDAGDLIDLWAIDERSGRADSVVTGVVVLAADGSLFTLAVPDARAGAVAVASFGSLVVTRVG